MNPQEPSLLWAFTQKEVSGSQLPGFESGICHFQLWDLSGVLPGKVDVKIKRANTCKMLDIKPGMEPGLHKFLLLLLLLSQG